MIKLGEKDSGYDGGGFCTICSFHVDSFDGLNCCPNCGATGVPCSDAEQVIVSVNTHELRILCIWAENWANTHKDVCVDAVYGIARRLRKQLGDKDAPLTMADEFQAIKDAGYEFETNHPAGDIP